MATTDNTDESVNPSNTLNSTWEWPCSFTQLIRSVEPFCNASWDGVSCWPPTKAGVVAVIPCFSELNSIKYDTSDNSSRLCLANGTWERNSNYSNCRPFREDNDIQLEDWGVDKQTRVIYLVGYSVSLAALVVALAIFIYFKDLRCLRNTFHANLMLTYVLVDCTWILTAVTSNVITEDQTGTCVLIIFLHYFKGTNFFWMFVEGFYLYRQVVLPFHENVKFLVYMLIGWGTPAIVVITWASVKAQLVNRQQEGPNELGQVSIGCPWMEAHHYDYIFIVPMLLILFVNVIFLFYIMRALIPKLREATTEESEQYRKVAKALLVLIPLLGVTYILVINAPTEGLWGAIFAYLRAILLSTQGFMVSVFFCFLNGEVRKVVRRHWDRWREERSMGYSSRDSLRCYRDSTTKDENVRLSRMARDRDSVSCVTSATYVGNGYSSVNGASMARWEVGRDSICVGGTVNDVSAV